MPRRKIFLVVLVAALWTPLLHGACSAGMTELRPIVTRGEKAEGFVLKDLDGKTYTFQPGKGGKPALLVFWVVACPLCREFVPRVSDLYARFGRDVRFIAVNLDGKRFSHAIRKFVRDAGIAFPVVLDDVRDDFFVASDNYGIVKTPTAVLVDGKGTVHSIWEAEKMKDLVPGRFAAIVSDLAKGAQGKK